MTTKAAEARAQVMDAVLAYHWPSNTSVGDKDSEQKFARAYQLANEDVNALIRTTRQECAVDIALRIEQLPRAPGSDGMDSPYITVDDALQACQEPT